MLIKYAKKVQSKPFVVEIGIKKTELSPPQEAKLDIIIKQKIEEAINCKLGNVSARITPYGLLWEYKDVINATDDKIGNVFITKVIEEDNIRFTLTLWSSLSDFSLSELTILSNLQS
jgi:hypothetical protein